MPHYFENIPIRRTVMSQFPVDERVHICSIYMSSGFYLKLILFSFELRPVYCPQGRWQSGESSCTTFILVALGHTLYHVEI